MSTTDERLAEQIELGEWAGFEAPEVDPSQPVGVTIVGMARAGKSTAYGYLTEAYKQIAPDGTEVLAFSNSNGFRGISLEALVFGKWDLDTPITPEVYTELLGAYLEATELEERAVLLDGLYRNPRPRELLRCRATDDAVPVTSEHASLRAEVNSAGARYLHVITHKPDTVGLPEPPRLVVLDARNIDECIHKFTSASVEPLGAYILTCPEDIAAERDLRKKGITDPAAIAAEAARNRWRNTTDRERLVAPMTLPEDLTHGVTADDLVKDDGSVEKQKLIEAGTASVGDPNRSIVIATNKVNEEVERDVLRYTLGGMLLQVAS
jgi:hypothetical protein